MRGKSLVESRDFEKAEEKGAPVARCQPVTADQAPPIAVRKGVEHDDTNERNHGERHLRPAAVVGEEEEGTGSNPDGGKLYGRSRKAMWTYMTVSMRMRTQRSREKDKPDDESAEGGEAETVDNDRALRARSMEGSVTAVREGLESGTWAGRPERKKGKKENRRAEMRGSEGRGSRVRGERKW